MKPRKAPGNDLITAEVFKAGGEEMKQMLPKIFNCVWKDKKTPSEWSKMLVSPIYKKGSKLDTENYQAISLLSIPGKVFSKILLNRMKVKSEQFLKDNQFGFQSGRGTIDAVFVVRQIMEKAKEHNVQLESLR